MIEFYRNLKKVMTKGKALPWRKVELDWQASLLLVAVYLDW